MPKFIDMTGQKFGRWTVLQRNGTVPKHGALWLCRCECGKEGNIRSDILRSGGSKSCGCLQAQMTVEMSKKRGNYSNKRIEMAGKTFGRLTVIIQAPKTNPRIIKWHCICACGKETIVDGSSLRSGNIISCGCSYVEKSTKHGKCGTPEYNAWASMKSRCYCPTCRKYKYWGGRGITICDRWLESFENFYADMGDRPTPKHSLDRIDNNGNYEPGNCRWATWIEQSKNRRRWTINKKRAFRQVNKKPVHP